MGLSEDIRQQLINSFKVEQTEHIQRINQGLLALEKDPGRANRPAILEEIFREVHSLKGAARAVGMTIIESLSHGMEELLLQAKEGRLTFTGELFDLLYQTLDMIEFVMAQVEAGDPTPPTRGLMLLARLNEVAQGAAQNLGGQADTKVKRKAKRQQVEEPLLAPAPLASEPQAVSASSSSADETIRVSVNKLDALMDQFSELLGAKIRAEQRLAEVRQMQAFAADWHKTWLGLRSHYGRLLRQNKSEPRLLAANRQTPASYDVQSAPYGFQDKDVATLLDFAYKNQEQLRAFSVQSNTLYRQLANDTLRLSLIINELQEEIKRVRMLPLLTITTTFDRMVRDLAREQGKQINLVINGGETELDKRVLEQVKAPLIHLLRNAVDHGLETPFERQRVGKLAEGQIILSASQQGNNVIVTISDDGVGLELSAIRSAAVRRGLFSKAEVEKLSEAEVSNLIFSSGLSTSKIITDISGRGVGLDVVRQNVEELHGTLEVRSVPRQGTTFTLILPLTLASSRGLLVQAGGQTFALPLTTVERMLYLDPSAITSVEGKAAITYQGRPVALAWLEDLLELPLSLREARQLTVVVIIVAEKRLGLIVDNLAGEQEMVIKSLGKPLVKVGGIAGATVLGSGQVVLVLHPADLVKLAGRIPARTSTSVKALPGSSPISQKMILVVDDSITTRTLEKNILEAAGYQVKLATDGEEALAVLVSDSLPHLIVSDVNMPQVDGFELTRRVRQDRRYANIPVILVTSLNSPADKARGIEVGADAYIVKSSFDQGNLLNTVEQLI